jgi:hypothetical protein
VANPRVHDTVTIDSEVWNVQAIVSQNAVVSVLGLTRKASAERASKTFRSE